MKRLTLGSLVLIAITSACTTPAYENNHWHFNSVGPRMTHQFLGYRQSRDGSYCDKLSEDGRAASLTLRRHFFNDNPDNPMLPQPARPPYRPQPPAVEFEVKNP
jgi:hypothetical protein